MRRVFAGLLALLLLAGAWLGWRLNDRPSLEPFEYLWLYSADPHAPGPQVTVTFFGVASLAISDGETTLMTDGFFTRPGKASVIAGRIAPDPAVIGNVLANAGIEKLAAVIAVHSHYDHAMDAPEVARRTGALLVGSASTRNIGLGAGLPEDRIRVIVPGEPMVFGAFTVTAIPSQHFPHGQAMGEITQPLTPPARALDYLEGGSFSLLFSHAAGSLLVQGSAGWRDGALTGKHADVVLLGVGGLGTRDEAYREGYWNAVVAAVAPRCVIPIHWDDFTLPLAEPLEPAPNLLDDFAGTMAFLERETSNGSPELGLLPPLEPVRLLGAGAARCHKAL